jgi:hypothetical protein
MPPITPPPTRFVKLRRLGFRRDSGDEVRIPAVKSIASGWDRDRRQFVVVHTLDLDAVDSLKVGDAGVLEFETQTANGADWRPVVMGRFRLDKPPAYRAGAREFTSARLLFVEVTAP